MFFLEFSCFFDDPMDVGDLISGSSAFSKSSLNIWKFMGHVPVKPGLEGFELGTTLLEEVKLCVGSPEYVKAVYCHPAYLTYMQSTS